MTEARRLLTSPRETSMSGPLVLNLGCGYRTSPRCINIDWSPAIRLRASKLGRRLAPYIAGRDRWEAFQGDAGEVLPHDLRRGIPFPDSSADAVYHSHVLEHLDRNMVPRFLAEIKRVLRPGGIHRIVVPDLELQARAYLSSLERALDDPALGDEHETRVTALIEQMVRREAHGSSTQPSMRRKLENLLLGDARKRGETHQWMWDRVSLTRELLAAGFTDPRVMTNTESEIPDWRGYGLDEDSDGSEYKPGSLYVEARS
jgi:SAM-dependent methyltransferase